MGITNHTPKALKGNTGFYQRLLNGDGVGDLRFISQSRTSSNSSLEIALFPKVPLPLVAATPPSSP